MIIDALTHVLPEYFVTMRDEVLERDATFRELFSNPNARIASAEDLIAEMDSAEVSMSVIAGFGWTDLDLAHRSNDYLLASASKYPDRLVPLCSVNPLWKGDIAEREAERCMISGAKGIGELHADSQGWVDRCYDFLTDLMRLLEEHSGIVLLHGSEPMGHLYQGKGSMTPDRLLRLAQSFPSNRFVFSHFGGGLPFYTHMPEVHKALSNVWFDSAASPFLYDSSVYASAAISAGSEKILFASDYPLIRQSRAVKHFRRVQLAKDKEAKILHRNAEALYGLRR